MDKFNEIYLNILNEWGYIRNGRSGYGGYTYHEYNINTVISAVKEVTNNGTSPWVKGETGSKILRTCKLIDKDPNRSNQTVTEDDKKLYEYWRVMVKQKPTSFNKKIADVLLTILAEHPVISQEDVGAAAYGIYIALKDNYTAPTVEQPAGMSAYTVGSKVSNLKIIIARTGAMCPPPWVCEKDFGESVGIKPKQATLRLPVF